jgi:regulation of enolase protein 1 (concanavalin A-like superfamily)
MALDLSTASWLNKPEVSEITDRSLVIKTEPYTDLWQRTCYGFSHDNAPALLLESQEDFSFSARVSFEYRVKYDQCGLLIYLTSDDWFKASVEYEDEKLSRLGSVVTNHGYSDWATTDIPVTTVMWYRLSRRGPDFLIESAPDGADFTQMRIFHLHILGETSEVTYEADSRRSIRFGLYACSPLESSFTAVFEHISLDPCLWTNHGDE